MIVPTVSVVIPTRDRAEKLARLLRCVKQQTYDNFECLVIDDGSSAETINAYDTIWQELDGRFLLHRKSENERGSGPGHTRNVGIRLARGTYIAFCDDDDLWIRDDHLAAATAAMTKYSADLYFANMQTSRDGVPFVKDWLSIESNILQRNSVHAENDIFLASRKSMCRFFRHRNLHADTLVIAKELLEKIGMYYERHIFGEDFDINFRLVDAAQKILFRTTIVADLDVSDHSSFVRSYQFPERLLFVILACLRVETQVSDPELRRAARAHRAWTLRDLARAMLAGGRRKEARELAVQALLLHPSVEALRTIGRSFL